MTINDAIDVIKNGSKAEDRKERIVERDAASQTALKGLVALKEIYNDICRYSIETSISDGVTTYGVRYKDGHLVKEQILNIIINKICEVEE